MDSNVRKISVDLVKCQDEMKSFANYIPTGICLSLRSSCDLLKLKVSHASRNRETTLNGLPSPDLMLPCHHQ